jgi:hypothetical protein
MSSPSVSKFNVVLTFQGISETIPVSTETSGAEIYRQTVQVFQLIAKDIDMSSMKLLFKAKRIEPSDDVLPFSNTKVSTTSKPPKIIVMATKQSSLQELSSKRSDPTIRGFDQEKQREQQIREQQQQKQQHWAEGMTQNKEYKFCRFQACTWQSFGHRPTDTTPHAFEAMQLLEKLATDPGIVAIMKERELVVGTLGEMDPIDDRLMHKTQQEKAGGCLLGYNTNAGARIDIKLRTDDLQAFRPYPELVATLIHELSHNWVGEHNLLFWTNFAQMRAEYLYTHARLRSTIVRGKTTAELAGLDKARLENVFDYIMLELAGEMRQHGLHPHMIQAPIRQRIEELEASHNAGLQLGTGGAGGNAAAGSARELALAAAERRARDQQRKKEQDGPRH